MKHLITLLLTLIYIHVFASCKNTNVRGDSGFNSLNIDSMNLKITIGESVFFARIYGNETVTAFKELLPLTLYMKELNGNEKYVDLPSSLPSNAKSHSTVEAGDLMLYGSKTLVLFYQSFPTSYAYTKLGRVANPSGLATALGLGNKLVKFEPR